MQTMNKERARYRVRTDHQSLTIWHFFSLPGL